ncbi:MAG: hypothetical protein GY855_02445 [candidate division Zixibacteria bacterium]|nr:hypothetical protein [candidate division Zixibacteria bacterium]
MRKLKNLLFPWGFIAVMIAALVVAGCTDKESTAPDEGDYPDIPPVETFKIDFTMFPDTNSTLFKPENSGDILSYNNWGYSAANVGVWSLLVTLGMVVPVASFVEAFNHTPEQQPDGSWAWSYNFNAGGVTHTADLNASTDSAGINWAMHISKTSHYTDFLFYTGQSNLVSTEGSWRLYQDPEDPRPFIDIEWERNPQDTTAEIKYINIIPGHDDSTGFIHYGRTLDDPYNLFFTIYGKSVEKLTEIAWNQYNGTGLVRDSIQFDDTLWHCWDSTLVDITCP